MYSPSEALRAAEYLLEVFRDETALREGLSTVNFPERRLQAFLPSLYTGVPLTVTQCADLVRGFQAEGWPQHLLTFLAALAGGAIVSTPAIIQDLLTPYERAALILVRTLNSPDVMSSSVVAALHQASDPIGWEDFPGQPLTTILATFYAAAASDASNGTVFQRFVEALVQDENLPRHIRSELRQVWTRLAPSLGHTEPMTRVLLSAEQRKWLHRLLCGDDGGKTPGAFDVYSLRIVIQQKLGWDLRQVVQTDRLFDIVALDAIKAIESRGEIGAFLRAIRDARPNRSDIQEFCGQFELEL